MRTAIRTGTCIGAIFLAAAIPAFADPGAGKPSPALKAGLKQNDVIMKIDTIDLKDSDTTELVKIVGGMRPGTVVNLAVIRNGEKLPIRVKLAPRPADFQSTPTYPLAPVLPPDN